VVRGERILKLEILAISGGTLYDLDKIHEQTVSSRSATPSKVEPSYDPRFDIDPMEASKPPKEVSEGESDVKTLLSENRQAKAESGNEDDEAQGRQSLDDASTLARDALSMNESNDTHDSLLAEPPGAPKKQTSTESDDDHGVMLSAPDVPDKLNVSDVSMTDISPVREEKEEIATATVAPFVDGEQLSLGNDDVAIGDVSIPRLESDASDVNDTGQEGDVEGAFGKLESDAEKEREPDTDGGANRKLGDEAISDEKGRKEDGEADEGQAMGRDGQAGRSEGRDVDEDEARRSEITEANREQGLSTSPDGGPGARKDFAETNTGVDVKPEVKEGRNVDKDREMNPRTGMDERGREADRAEDVDRKLGERAQPAEGRTRTVDDKGGRGVETGVVKREEDTRPPKRDNGEVDNEADSKRDAGPMSGTQEVDRKDGVGTKPSPGMTERTTSENRHAQAGGITDDGRGSISLILGPSVRNFAHLALSPLTALRTFLGPAPNSRPSRRKRFRRADHPGNPEYVRMRSFRSALVTTPYQAAATSLGNFLTRRNNNRTRKSGSTESESSSED